MEKRKIILYLDEIYKIGGIETWLYNLTSSLKDDFDFLVLWRNADPDQLARLEVLHEKYDPSKEYRCDILLNMISGRPFAVRAKKTIQVIHANYSELLKTFRYNHWDRTEGFIFVSETSRQCFTFPLSGYPNVVLTNPVYVLKGIEKKTKRRKNSLVLVAATRLTSEKGGHRYPELVRQIRDAGIKVKMHIWTNWTLDRFNEAYHIEDCKNCFCFHEPKLGLYQEMADADYVVQLSDGESFCYTVHEALAVHTPVLVTKWDGVENVVRNGLNGFIYDMDMKKGPLPQKLLNPPHVFGVPSGENSEGWKKYLASLPLPKDYNSGRFNYFLK